MAGVVPTEVPYDCLIVDSYKLYVNEEGRTVYNHCGSAYLCSVDFTGNTSRRVSLKHENGTSGNRTVVVTVSATPSAVQPFPCDTDVRNRSSRLVARAKAWQRIQPIDKDLSEVHIPKFACPFPWLPGFFFGVQRPTGFESELLFDRALRVCARRRCWDADEVVAKGGHDMRILTARRWPLYPTAVSIMPMSTSATQIDRFSADERVLMNGDCEDGARMLSTLAWSLRHGNYKSPLVVAAQKAVRCYVVAQMFGDVALPADPANDAYKTGRYYAHSFNMFLPVAWVKGALQRGGDTAALAAPVPQEAAETMTQDGISTEDPDAKKPTHVVAFGPSGLSRGDRRIRKIDTIGLDYYKIPSSCLIVDDTIISKRYGTPIYELGFVTGTKYGCTYANLLNQSAEVSLVPACELTAQEDAIAKRCVSYLHPIVPFDTSAPEPDLHVLEATLGATRSKNACKPGKGVFFLQGHDCTDVKYLEGLKRRIPTGRSVQYALDFFAKDVFTVEVFLI